MKTWQTTEKWAVEFHEEFVQEFRRMDLEQRRALVAAARALELSGPRAGRPLVGTLDNPKHPNMKELRYEAHTNQVWRAAFAFDPGRRAIVLVAANKQGTDEKRFYRELLKKANERYDTHLHGHRAKDVAVSQEGKRSPGKTKEVNNRSQRCTRN